MMAKLWHRLALLALLGLNLILLPAYANDLRQSRNDLDTSPPTQPQIAPGDHGLVADVDGDGDLDTIVGYATGDAVRGTLSWYENLDGEGQRWRKRFRSTRFASPR